MFKGSINISSFLFLKFFLSLSNYSSFFLNLIFSPLPHNSSCTESSPPSIMPPSSVMQASGSGSLHALTSIPDPSPCNTLIAVESPQCPLHLAHFLIPWKFLWSEEPRNKLPQIFSCNLSQVFKNSWINLKVQPIQQVLLGQWTFIWKKKTHPYPKLHKLT